MEVLKALFLLAVSLNTKFKKFARTLFRSFLVPDRFPTLCSMNRYSVNLHSLPRRNTLKKIKNFSSKNFENKEEFFPHVLLKGREFYQLKTSSYTVPCREVQGLLFVPRFPYSDFYNFILVSSQYDSA